MSNISYTEVQNRVAANIYKIEQRFDELVSKISEATECLYSDASQHQKYDAILSIEFLLVKLRLDSEFEHLKIKSILSNQETPPAVRGIFMKRDQYLAQVTLKLNAIRDDISVLQKCVYTQSTRNIK